MKKIAFFLFMVFASVQLLPAVTAVCMDTCSVFVADEEKGEENRTGKDFKEKKDWMAFFGQSDQLTLTLQQALQLTEKIHSSPCLEKLTPPPNHC